MAEYSEFGGVFDRSVERSAAREQRLASTQSLTLNNAKMTRVNAKNNVRMTREIGSPHCCPVKYFVYGGKPLAINRIAGI